MYIYIYICIYIYIERYVQKTCIPSFSDGVFLHPRRFWGLQRSMLFQNGRTVNQLFDALSAGKASQQTGPSDHKKNTTKKGRCFFGLDKNLWNSWKYMVIEFFCLGRNLGLIRIERLVENLE